MIHFTIQYGYKMSCMRHLTAEQPNVVHDKYEISIILYYYYYG